MLNSAMIDLLGVSLWETLYMVVISTILSYAVGLPIGVVLNITGKDGICQNRKFVQWVLFGFMGMPVQHCHHAVDVQQLQQQPDVRVV